MTWERISVRYGPSPPSAAVTQARSKRQGRSQASWAPSPCLCRPDEAAAFFRRQALGRGDKISFRPGSDFKKDDLAAVFADKVQFQMPVTPVAVKDNPAPRPRFRRRGLLSGPARDADAARSRRKPHGGGTRGRGSAQPALLLFGTGRDAPETHAVQGAGTEAAQGVAVFPRAVALCRAKPYCGQRASSRVIRSSRNVLARTDAAEMAGIRASPSTMARCSGSGTPKFRK